MTPSTTPSPGLGQPALTTSTVYDPSLRAVAVTQPDGTSVTNQFFPTGLLQETFGSRTYPVAYTYDYAGRMKTMTTWQNFAANSGAAVTTWNYDPYRGWLTNKTYNAGAPGPSYTYTPAGRLASRIWARNGTDSNPIVTSYSYNACGDLASVGYSSNDPQQTPDLNYFYDRRGRQITINEYPTPLSQVTLTYNNANELISETHSWDALNGLSITNRYDSLLRRTNLAVFQSNNPLIQQSFGFDSASRLQTVQQATNGAVYSYVANSPLVGQIIFTNSGTTRMTTTKNYDFLNRLISISSAPSSPPPVPAPSAVSFNYSYNKASQRVLSVLADGSYWLYEYDSLGQVTRGAKFWSDFTPVAGQQFQYSFDTIGNRTSTRAGGDQNGANLRSASYSANLLNQYTNRTVPGAVDITGLELATNSVAVNGLTAYRKGEYFRQQLPATNSSSAQWLPVFISATNETTVTGDLFVPRTPEQFTYDLDGNLASDGRFNYYWDAENRLVGMVANTSVGPQLSLSFAYDWQGRRISKTVSNYVSSAWQFVSQTAFVHDGWNLIAELTTLNASSALTLLPLGLGPKWLGAARRRHRRPVAARLLGQHDHKLLCGL